MARRLPQPISRRLRLVCRRPVCGSSRISPGTPTHSYAALRPCPHHAARDRVRGALARRGTKPAAILATTRRDGTLSNGFAVARPIMGQNKDRERVAPARGPWRCPAFAYLLRGKPRSALLALSPNRLRRTHVV